MTNLCGVSRGGQSIAAWLAASVAIAGALIMPAVAQANNPGAIWTTTSTCGPVNVNSYASKLDVYLNGGPDSHGANGLPDGSYWVEVIVPGGEVLGRSSSAVVEVVDGRMAQCYQLWAITRQAPAFTQVGYLDTTNPGGSYNVLVSQDPGFVGGTTKSDHFKVVPQTTTTSTTTSSTSTSTTSTTTSSTSTATTATTSTVSTTTTSGTNITSTTTPVTSATTGQTSTISTAATAVVSGITGGPTTGGEVEGISAGPILPPTTTDNDSQGGGAATSLTLLLLAGAVVIMSMGLPVNVRMKR